MFDDIHHYGLLVGDLEALVFIGLHPASIHVPGASCATGDWCSVHGSTLSLHHRPVLTNLGQGKTNRSTPQKYRGGIGLYKVLKKEDFSTAGLQNGGEKPPFQHAEID